MSKVYVFDHPLIQHKIGYIRRKETGTKDFRQTIGEIAMLICYEATRDLKLKDVEIETNEYFYTPNGDLAEIHKVEYGKKGVTTYRYLEYDSYGNWTRRKVLYLRDNENVVCDEIRLIIYYKETQ